jgi:hypothetical protein
MARGGIVTRATRALLGESGPEAVVPLSKNAGLGDVHFDFHPTINGFGDIAGLLREHAEQMFTEFERVLASRFSAMANV